MNLPVCLACRHAVCRHSPPCRLPVWRLYCLPYLNCASSQVANEVIEGMNLKPEEVFLAQGTLRPDLIESASHLASGKADIIKTHHNDTELIRKLRDEVPHMCT